MTAGSPMAIDLPQGTPEWLAWRAGVVTASEAAVAMGCTPGYFETRTWEDLRRLKAAGGEPAEPDPETARIFAHGHQWEPVARLAMSRVFALPDGHWYEPACWERGQFGASLDGMATPVEWLTDSGDGRIAQPAGGWCEIKCPFRGWSSATAREVLAGRVPEHIWWQMVHQAGVLFGHLPRDRWPNTSVVLGVFCPPQIVELPDTRLHCPSDAILIGLLGEGAPPGAGELADHLVKECMAIHITHLSRLLGDWPQLADRWQRFLAGHSQPGMFRPFP